MTNVHLFWRAVDFMEVDINYHYPKRFICPFLGGRGKLTYPL